MSILDAVLEWEFLRAIAVFIGQYIPTKFTLKKKALLVGDPNQEETSDRTELKFVSKSSSFQFQFWMMGQSPAA